jgi:hypothetical protein
MESSAWRTERGRVICYPTLELRDSIVKLFLGSIQWSNGADFCPDMLYLDSSPTTALIHDSMKKIRANVQELA